MSKLIDLNGAKSVIFSYFALNYAINFFLDFSSSIFKIFIYSTSKNVFSNLEKNIYKVHW